MILIAEIVDFQRFGSPRELMAYLGLVPSEYSTGDTERRGALTKAGNSHARRVLVEAAWHYRHRPTVGGALARRSQGQPPALVSQSWRAQQRLHRRYHTWSAMANVPRSRWPPSRESWWASSGRRSLVERVEPRWRSRRELERRRRPGE
jgi:Transposase IS116/IS110/IS902 family